MIIQETHKEDKVDGRGRAWDKQWPDAADCTERAASSAAGATKPKTCRGCRHSRGKNTRNPACVHHRLPCAGVELTSGEACAGPHRHFEVAATLELWSPPGLGAQLTWVWIPALRRSRSVTLDRSQALSEPHSSHLYGGADKGLCHGGC